MATALLNNDLHHRTLRKGPIIPILTSPLLATTMILKRTYHTIRDTSTPPLRPMPIRKDTDTVAERQIGLRRVNARRYAVMTGLLAT